MLSCALAPAEVLPGIPPALRYFSLDPLRDAMKTGCAADYPCAAAALTGPLRHLLRRPYLARLREDDVTYQAQKVPTSPARQMVTVHTVDVGRHRRLQSAGL
ncbi:hypothetical protein ACIP5N_33215 [Streptomyces sp. NPDC088768]|uniref:hypothetical protein n=1 Tax=Streptomyces sp. NPDC088768 TaxID=3365894 RepID=UPI00381A27BC